MPRRPRQHILEDIARAELHRVFTEIGWAVENLTKDYGEDLLVRIFSDGNATPLSFYIQSKSTDHVRTITYDDEQYVRVRISTDHLAHWRLFWQPVVLTQFDASSGITYWEIIQDIAPSSDASGGRVRKVVTLRVPCKNQLDAQGVRRLRRRTLQRFEQFKAQKDGAEILIEQLRDLLGLRITYEPEGGLLMVPKGAFHEAPEGGQSVTIFGPLASRLTALCETTGLSPDVTLHEALRITAEVMSAFDAGRTLQVRSAEGKVMEEWKSSKAFFKFLKQQREEDEGEV